MGWTTDTVLSATTLSTMLDRVSEILRTQDTCVLGTVGDCGAQLTPCFFAPLSEYRLVFVSSKNAGHVANLRTDPRCSVLVLPGQVEQGRLVSLQLSGEVSCLEGVGKLGVLRAYVARMNRRIPSVLHGVHDFLDKQVFVLEVTSIALLDTGIQRGVMRLEKGQPGTPSAEAA